MLATVLTAACGGAPTPTPPTPTPTNRAPVSDHDFACAGALVVSAWPSPGPRIADPDDTSLAGARIASLRVEGTRVVPSSLVFSTLTTHAGDIVDGAKLADDERRVMALGAFEDVALRRVATAGGVALVATVHERPLIGRAFFVDDSESMARAYGFAPRPGDVFDPTALDAAAKLLERTWIGLGNPLAKVELRARRSSTERVDVCLLASGGDPSASSGLKTFAAEMLEEMRHAVTKDPRPARPYDDETLVAYVASVGERVGAVAGFPHTFRFIITDDGGVSADSLVNRIRVSRGLLGALRSEAQLAAVLGHEIGHAALRHSMYAALEQSFDGAKAGYCSPSAQMQADQLGARYAELLGYDPHELLTALAAISLTRMEMDEPTDPAGLLSRIAVAARALDGRSGGRVGAEAYAARIDGLPWGPASSPFPTAPRPLPRIRFRPGRTAGTREEVLAATCPAGPSAALLVRLNGLFDERVEQGAPIKCIVAP